MVVVVAGARVDNNNEKNNKIMAIVTTMTMAKIPLPTTTIIIIIRIRRTRIQHAYWALRRNRSSQIKKCKTGDLRRIKIT